MHTNKLNSSVSIWDFVYRYVYLWVECKRRKADPNGSQDPKGKVQGNRPRKKEWVLQLSLRQRKRTQQIDILMSSTKLHQVLVDFVWYLTISIRIQEDLHFLHTWEIDVKLINFWWIMIDSDELSRFSSVFIGLRKFR